MYEVQIQGVDEFSRMQYFCHGVFQISIVLLNDQTNTLDDNVLGEIATEQPQELVVVETIPLMIFKLKYLDKIVQETNPVHGRLIKRGKGLQQNMLALVTLRQVLGYGLTWRQCCLCYHKTCTFLKKILLHSPRMLYN